jgi:hypothetical protein
MLFDGGAPSNAVAVASGNGGRVGPCWDAFLRVDGVVWVHDEDMARSGAAVVVFYVFWFGVGFVLGLGLYAGRSRSRPFLVLGLGVVRAVGVGHSRPCSVWRWLALWDGDGGKFRGLCLAFSLTWLGLPRWGDGAVERSCSEVPGGAGVTLPGTGAVSVIVVFIWVHVAVGWAVGGEIVGSFFVLLFRRVFSFFACSFCFFLVVICAVEKMKIIRCSENHSVLGKLLGVRETAGCALCSVLGTRKIARALKNH